MAFRQKNITYMQILQDPNNLDLNLNMHNNKGKLVTLNKQFNTREIEYALSRQC